MHRALRIREIRQLIFAFVAPSGLFHLALTCKAFFDAAIDQLWETIYSIKPLLSCLPTDYQYQYRKLHVDDLQRYNYYIPKIRNVIFEHDNQGFSPLPFTRKRKYKAARFNPEKEWADIWEEIAGLVSTPELWCNLQRVQTNNVDERIFLPLVGMPGTKLIQLRLRHIINPQSESVIGKMLLGMQEKPKLKALFIRDHDTQLAALIRQSPIKYMRFEPRLTDGQQNQKSALHEILKKSDLIKLTLSLHSDWYHPAIDGLNNRYLPKLKTLWLDLYGFKPTGHCGGLCVNCHADSWTCRNYSGNYVYNHHSRVRADCGRRSPAVFLKGLDSPELKELNIKFPPDMSGKVFLEIMSAVGHRGRLEELTHLALSGRTWEGTSYLNPPKLQSADFRAGLRTLLPLPGLKVLRLSVAPNFLDILDHNLYRTIAAGLPALGTLMLGHEGFYYQDQYSEVHYERVSLPHLAIFCSLLPNLKSVSIGTLDGLTLEKRPKDKWASPSLVSMTISHYVDVTQGEVLRMLRLGMKCYFPNCDLVKDKFFNDEKRFKEPRR